MKLRNKKTGEIVDYIRYEKGGAQIISVCAFGTNKHYYYNSLAELNEEWEDCNELEYYYIDNSGDIVFSDLYGKSWEELSEERKQIGNYFENEEEAEKAVEKLKAWKRLKDKGFRFIGKTYETDKRFGSIFYKVDDDTYSEDIIHELDLLFGGEE